uniref:TPR_REGION domain-containing protein n=1 Tax=Rhabditophanes sp. KR3021 TaxID=114890 RepID=A0AC35UA20_9BILA
MLKSDGKNKNLYPIRKTALALNCHHKNISIELLKSERYCTTLNQLFTEGKLRINEYNDEDSQQILSILWNIGCYTPAKFLRRQMLCMDDKPFFVRMFQNAIDVYHEIGQTYPKYNQQCMIRMGDLCRYAYDIDKENVVHIERAKCYYEILFKNDINNGHVLNMLGLVYSEMKKPLFAIQLFLRACTVGNNYSKALENVKQCRPSSDDALENEFVRCIVRFLKIDLDSEELKLDHFSGKYMEIKNSEKLFDFYYTTVLLVKGIFVINDENAYKYLITKVDELSETVLDIISSESHHTGKIRPIHLFICCALIDWVDLFCAFASVPKWKISLMEKDRMIAFCERLCTYLNVILGQDANTMETLSYGKKMYFWNTRNFTMMSRLNVGLAVMAHFITQVKNNHLCFITFQNNLFQMKEDYASNGNAISGSISRAYFDHQDRLQFAKDVIPSYIVPTEDVFMYQLRFINDMKFRHKSMICVDPTVIRVLDAMKTSKQQARSALAWIEKNKNELIFFEHIVVFPRDYPKLTNGNSICLRSMVLSAERLLNKRNIPADSENVIAVLLMKRDPDGTVSFEENMMDYSYENSFIKVDNPAILISTLFKFKHLIELVTGQTTR